MLLSEAIRLGAMLGPQYRGKAFGPNNSTCALGSAALAIGCDSSSLYPSRIEKHWPILTNGLGREIARKNDSHDWTREQIADWLVQSGNDCSSVEIAPAQEIAAALVSKHMVAR